MWPRPQADVITPAGTRGLKKKSQINWTHLNKDEQVLIFPKGHQNDKLKSYQVFKRKLVNMIETFYAS